MPPPLVLRLEDVRGAAILRNKRFIIKSPRGPEAGYAVALHCCRDVQFGGNTVEGVRQRYLVDEDGSATEEGTQVGANGQCWLRPWWLRLRACMSGGTGP